jgi:MFS transporter, NNP family, nitrate/nitrite transporter
LPHLAVQLNLVHHGINAAIVDAPAGVMDKKSESSSSTPPAATDEKLQYDASGERKKSYDWEAALPKQEMHDTACGEVVHKPSYKEAMRVVFSLQTLVTTACYFCSFGTELSVNSILGTFYLKNFKTLGQTGSGNWAAMFGLLNVVFRPIGGLVADYLFRKSGNVWYKKIWLHLLAVVTGAFLIAIGVLDSKDKNAMFGLIAGMVFFLEAGNGANYALVPHVHPHANGIVSGVTGAAGNFGGIIFAIIFRECKTEYAKPFWIIGVITIVLNLAVSWIKPITKDRFVVAEMCWG